MAVNERIEHDSFGPIAVAQDALWGAQTQRSLKFFQIGSQSMPIALLHALGWIKWAAAVVNRELGRLPAAKADAIALIAQRIALGQHDAQFPLSVWQTGSGTQTHMNVNEVIANLASAQLGGPIGTARLVHPNDEVNLGQSTNDVFPTAMHIAASLALRDRLLPSLIGLRGALQAKAREFASIQKVGRTHWQDAAPLSLGEEFGGYDAQLASCESAIRDSTAMLHRLAIGATAVGTGLNTDPRFGKRVAALLSQRLGCPFEQADNLFAALAGHEPVLLVHGALTALAAALTKIANDLRCMASGPRAGLGELNLPANEPGSSIMPGKVNPTQIEALTMVCAQVFGHQAAIGFAASQGHFELNAYKPLLIYDLLDSIDLLSGAMNSFTEHCVSGISADRARIAELLRRSLMLATALTPALGYERAARIVEYAHQHQLTLRDAVLATGELSAEDFDALMAQWLG